MHSVYSVQALRTSNHPENMTSVFKKQGNRCHVFFEKHVWAVSFHEFAGVGKIAAMISAGSSTCGAEAESAAEDDAEAEAEAGGVLGRNNGSQFSDRCSEGSAI